MYRPLRANKVSTVQDGGVVYVVTGGGGRGLYEEDSTPDRLQETYAVVNHFVYGVIDGCTLQLTAIDLDGNIFDESVIDHC